ncbi:tripartite tricarboxylate transporter TctB family protein [Kocuria palustris]|uniref:tripartite tricarboxylate transporter TctB family protein n=1 Tax=Kocuria palustris TaxID=71999 RepID=UPI0011A6D888|nr:tripartite tricarboxylate transporter TctB family protein [Kocuria palustris]
MSRPAFLLRELLTPAVLLAFATYLLVNLFLIEVPDSADFPGPRFFPAIIAGLMYLLLGLELIRILRDARRLPEHEPAETAPPRGFDWPALAWTVGGFVVFIATLRLLGWVLAAALLFWCVARGFGDRRPLTSAAAGLTISSLAYIAFDMGLGLNLPSGILGGAF